MWEAHQGIISMLVLVLVDQHMLVLVDYQHRGGRPIIPKCSSSRIYMKLKTASENAILNLVSRLYH